MQHQGDWQDAEEPVQEQDDLGAHGQLSAFRQALVDTALHAGQHNGFETESMSTVCQGVVEQMLCCPGPLCLIPG